jgi:SprT protein
MNEIQFNELKIRVNNKISDCINKLEEKFGTKLRFPTIGFDIRGQVAGYAYWSKNKIRLNLKAFELEPEDMIENTVPHELAHLYARRHFGHRIKPHGNEWKTVMRALGIEAKRCHSYALPMARSHKKYSVHCEKCNFGFELTKIRINKMRKGTNYRHRKCGGKLVFGPAPLSLDEVLV